MLFVLFIEVSFDSQPATYLASMPIDRYLSFGLPLQELFKRVASSS